MPTWSTSSIVTPAVNRQYLIDSIGKPAQCLKRLKRSSSTAAIQFSISDNRRRRIPVIRINAKYDHSIVCSLLMDVSELRIEEGKPSRLKGTKTRIGEMLQQAKFVTSRLGDLVVICFQFQVLTQSVKLGKNETLSLARGSQHYRMPWPVSS